MSNTNEPQNPKEPKDLDGLGTIAVSLAILTLGFVGGLVIHSFTNPK